MKPHVPRAALVLLLAAGLAAAYRPGNRQDYAAASAQAMEVWGDWTAELLLSDSAPDVYVPSPVADGRVLLWCSRSSKGAKPARTAEKTLAAFDALMPPATRGPDAPPVQTAVLFELSNQESLASVSPRDR